MLLLFRRRYALQRTFSTKILMIGRRMFRPGIRAKTVQGVMKMKRSTSSTSDSLLDIEKVEKDNNFVTRSSFLVVFLAQAQAAFVYVAMVAIRRHHLEGCCCCGDESQSMYYYISRSTASSIRRTEVSSTSPCRRTGRQQTWTQRLRACTQCRRIRNMGCQLDCRQ